MRVSGYPYVAMRTAALDVRACARLFKALGDETRVRIVALLSHGELCVCHIQSALRLPQPSISRHLASLRAAGVVEDRREGSWVHYRLKEQADEACQAQVRALVATFADNAAVLRDSQRLREVMRKQACR